MKATLKIGLAALVGVTLVSIGMSIVIPTDNARDARSETMAAWTLGRTALTRAGDQCNKTRLSHEGLVAQVTMHDGHCTAQVILPTDRTVTAIIRGARVNVISRASGIRCLAEGGHGAGPLDFPAICHYHTQEMLL